MDDSELTINDKPKDLEYAEQLINESRFTEAYQVLTELSKNENTPLFYKVSCHLLQCRIFIWQGKYNDCYKVAELAYKKSLGLDKDLRTVEALSLMSLSLLILRKFNEGFNLVHQAEIHLKTFQKKNSPHYNMLKALIAQNKGYYYFWSLENRDLGLKYLEESLSLRKIYSSKVEIAMGFYGVGSVLYGHTGEFNRALEYLEQGLTFAYESGNKWAIIMILNVLGNLYSSKGELDRAIGYYKDGLERAKEINNINLVMYLLMDITDLYREKCEFDLALDYLEQAITKCEEIENQRDLVALYATAIDLFLAKSDRKQAQEYFRHIEYISKQTNDKWINLVVLLYNALLLEASSKFRDKIRAQEKLRQILKEENLSYLFEVYTLTHLCDLLFTELRITNEIEIVQEIKPLITRLREIAEKSNSYRTLCESYLLQAKFALLELDINTARRLFTQSTQIAKRYELKQLIQKISDENKEFIEKVDLWEHLKEIEAPLSDRLKLIRLDPEFESIIRRRTILTANIKEEKVVIHKEKKICLVCRGEVLKYSYICECGAIYCENCARALTNLENACWVCNRPIDYSKPIKIDKEREKTKIHKKGKSK
ncbi:MAG: tetratricopeptide repeat protein [Promethearchaeota archaeon]